MPRRGVLKEGHVPPFRGRPWREIRQGYVERTWPELQPLIDVVESVLIHGGAERLVATTSMDDLWVARRKDDGPASSVDLIKVRAITSMRPVNRGEVVIEHTSPSGQVEAITRPGAEAVPLFWRFVREKWGIEPWRWEYFDDAQRHVILLASERAGLYETTWLSTNVDAEGQHQVPLIHCTQARQIMVELLRLGLVEVVLGDEDAERAASDKDLVELLGVEVACRQSDGNSPARLALTPAGANWFSQRGSVT